MKTIKVLAAILASLIGVLVLAAVALVLLFDPNDYKRYLTDWVEQRTGRPLTVTGDLELRFFPWLAVETGGVTLGNAAGFDTEEPFATADRVAAEVKLMPLLRRRVEIGTVRLDGLRLNLARDATGRGNWEALAGPDNPDAPSSGSDAGGAWMESLDAEGLRVQDGLVHWREDGELRYVASGIMLETGAIEPGEAVEASLIVDVLDVASQRTFKVEAESGVLLGDGAADNIAVELRDFGFGLTLVDGQNEEVGEGRLDATLVQAAADGRIEIGGARVEGLLPGVSSAPNGLRFGGQWRLAVLDPVTGSLQIDELATDVAGVQAQWQVEGRSLIDSPEIEGSVMVASESIADALATFDVALPAGADAATLGTLDAAAAFRIALAPPNAATGGADDDASPGAPARSFHIGSYRLVSMSLSNVDARALGLELRGEGRLVDDATLEARIEVPQFTASEALLAVARANAPETIDVGALERIAFSSGIAVELDSGSIRLNDVRAALLDADLNGNVEIRPETGGKVYRGALKTSRFEPDRLAMFLGEHLSEGLAPDEIGTLAFDGRFVYDTRTDRLALEQLALEAFGLTATGTATVSDLRGSPVSRGQARVAAFSPRDLMRRFGQAVPNTSDDSVLQRASIDAAFAVDTENGRFTDIALVLDDSRITGDFTVSNFQDPGYSFALALDKVDVDRYLPPRAVDAADDAAADATDDAPTAGDIELPMQALENLSLDGRVSVGALRLAGLDFQDVATNIDIGNGAGSLDSARAKLYGGEFAGSFKVAAVDGQPGLTLSGRASNLTLEPMIVALTGDANFQGTGDFDLDLSGRGATVTENVRSANGNVMFALKTGVVEGFNLGRTLCSVYNTTQKLPAPADQPKATAYEVISGTASVKDGVASSPDLLARTSFMDVTGRGSLGLAEQRLDYDLDAKLTGSIGIRGCESMDRLIGESIPFTLRGTVTDPDIRPDFSEIIQRRIKDEIQDRIGERIQDRLRDLLR